ncbi:MAG: hypothetical protein JWP34_3272, partial [Massilia sp.]|nr:hypothetical protein [Massilia sp.]
HHIWFAISGDTDRLLHGFVVMFIGDLAGTLIVVYAVKGILALLPASVNRATRRSSRSSRRAPRDPRRPRRPP